MTLVPVPGIKPGELVVIDSEKGLIVEPAKRRVPFDTITHPMKFSKSKYRFSRSLPVKLAERNWWGKQKIDKKPQAK